MTWNKPVHPGGLTFGPAAWRGDLIVTGESRGKLYRTRVARRADGEFIAVNQLIGCLPMLTVDCTVSPRGDLLVACHSGGPDWGTGPTGKGKIFVVRYDQPSLPQPSHAFVASPRELRVVFDRPLDPTQLKDLARSTEISFGQYVAAADRFETIRPGYAVTDLQQSQNRFKLPIHAAGLTPDRTTLVFATDPIDAPLHYAIKLPGMGRPAAEEASSQHPDIDLAFAPNGWEVHCDATESSPTEWHGWLPHPDLSLSRRLLLSSHAIDELLGVCQDQRVFDCATKLDLQGVFVPAVQPLSQLDYDPGDDHWVTQRAVVIDADCPFEVTGNDNNQSSVKGEHGEYHATLLLASGADRWLELRLTSQIAASSVPKFDISWHVTLADGQQRKGPLALHRFYLPWVDPTKIESQPPTKRVISELAGGDRERGRELFLNQELGCAKCHSTQTVKEGLIGPDLSNLVHRDYASVFRDITQPSHAINPDYITYNLELRDGRVLTGTVRSDGESLRVGSNEGKELVVPKSEVASMVAGPISTMPTGLFDKLTEEQRRDLLTFLMVSEP
jgi:putative heme-binding domain-containing protein